MRGQEYGAADRGLASFGCGKSGGLAPVGISVKPEPSQGLEGSWAWTLSREFVSLKTLPIMPWTSRSRGPGHGVIERCIRVDSRNCRRAHKCWRLQDNQYFPCYCDQMPKENNQREVILAHGTRDSVHGKNGGRNARRLLTVRLRLPAVRQWRESNPALDHFLLLSRWPAHGMILHVLSWVFLCC